MKEREKDVKYLHKSCNTKKNPIHKMRNATSLYITWKKNRENEQKKIRLHKSIFIYFSFQLSTEELALIRLLNEKLW